MCHDFFNDAKFYRYLYQLDYETAIEIQAAGCPYCGGKLHCASYPRKPRGIRGMLDTSYQSRLSFCCTEEGCRRRTTPPSVRFLGRKVYLGIIIILVTALENGLSARRRQQLIEQLDLWPQTIARWRKWWRVHFPNSRYWQLIKSRFMPPLDPHALPADCLGRVSASADLQQRLCLLLRLLAPITTTSCPSSMQGDIFTQNM